MKKTHKNKYIHEGFIVLHSWFDQEWQPLRTGCRGRPEIYPEKFIEFCSRLRYINQFSFRALEGFLEALQSYLSIPRIANYTTLWRRIVQKAQVKQSFTSKKYKYLIVDSSGMSNVKRSGYLQYKWRTRREYTKIHFGINEFQEIVFFDVTKEKGGSDSKIALDNIKQLNYYPERLYGDGGYDNRELFNLCYELGIKPVIPVRKNAKAKTLAQPLRAREIRAQKDNFEQWKLDNNYGLRTGVERSFSAFKRRFGDACRSLKYELQSVFRMVQCFVWLQNINGGEYLCN